ncbi:MAG: hypothetical protein JWN70_1803 [Planctomycetaceae bacterium]|nr:hypothetical protein [Planctomycetaceae bacterium]
MPSLFFKTVFPWQTLPASVPTLSRQLLLVTIGLLFATQAVAGPRVDVVVGPKATALERFAASEVAVQFKKLFDADVKVSEQVPAEAGSLILIGSPTTNPALQPLAATWPKLSDQGHLIRSVKLGDRKVLVAGGGSPVATLWAAYELGHHFGIRYALYGDMYPGEPVELKLDGIDILLEPTLRSRTWWTIGNSPIGPESWGQADQEQLLKQLAKLKFNRVVLWFDASQPYLDFEFKGVKKQTGVVWRGERFPVDGDTGGRTAFHGAKFFENPDFTNKKTYGERVAAATLRARGIIETCRKLGMSPGLGIEPLEFPREFASVLSGGDKEKDLQLLTVSPGTGQKIDDARLMELVQAQLQAYLKTYPNVDFISLTLPAPVGWANQAETAWKELDPQTRLGKSKTFENLTTILDSPSPAVVDAKVKMLKGKIASLAFFKRLLTTKDLGLVADGHTVKFEVNGIFPVFFPLLDKVLPPGVAARNSLDLNLLPATEKRSLMKGVPTERVASSLSLPLAHEVVGVLPQMSGSALKSLVDELRESGWNGFELNCSTIGEMDFNAYYLSRASFQSELNTQQALTMMLAPTLGEASAGRTWKAFEEIEQVTALIDKNDFFIGAPHKNMVMQYYQSSEPVPEWWGKAQELYFSAMNEMYRVNTRAREGNREFSLYLARRFEFAGEYLGCLMAVRRAGIAKSKGDTETQMAELEKAVESLNSALNALAAVARSNSDRGVIAVLNEYGYRPLKKELEAE